MGARNMALDFVLILGAVVALGIILVFLHLPWKKKMWCLSHPVQIDVCVFTLLTAIHWGTFSGVIVATVGALVCSICLSIGRWLYGYVANNKYYPGVINVFERIK